MMRHINDLLKPAVIPLEDSIIRELVEGRRVLVTGGGGSIGSEICRQLLRFHPENLILLGRGENRIFFLDRELRESNPAVTITPVIADVANAGRMRCVFEEFAPDFVFHTAAHKHVPLMETHISEAIHNNVYGTKVVADLSGEHEVTTFVLVSTDKAVNPTSVMGTTKRMAEQYVCAMSNVSRTKFVTIRLGNILGSTGSVVSIFFDQIRNGGPVTVTDERMTRYFMTIPEAAQWTLLAAVTGQGGEIFIPDMGEPVKIVDLARNMIRLAGLSENAIEIRFTGLRPGEKLHEQLYFAPEQTQETPHPKLRLETLREFSPELLNQQVRTLCDRLNNASQQELRDLLQKFVPEYRPFQEK